MIFSPLDNSLEIIAILVTEWLVWRNFKRRSPATYYVETNFIGQLHDEYSRIIKKVVDLFLFHEFSYDKNVIIKIVPVWYIFAEMFSLWKMFQSWNIYRLSNWIHFAENWLQLNLYHRNTILVHKRIAYVKFMLGFDWVVMFSKNSLKIPKG